MKRSFAEPLRRAPYAEASFHYEDLLNQDSEDDASKRRARDNRRETPNGLQYMHCKYRGKMCCNPRAWKIDGTLHSMCDLHRLIANKNQRRADKRKRKDEPRTRHAKSSPSIPMVFPWVETTEAVSSVNVPSPGKQKNEPRARLADRSPTTLPLGELGKTVDEFPSFKNSHTSMLFPWMEVAGAVSSVGIPSPGEQKSDPRVHQVDRSSSTLTLVQSGTTPEAISSIQIPIGRVHSDSMSSTEVGEVLDMIFTTNGRDDDVLDMLLSMNADDDVDKE